jgi:uncharacterized membrane protein YjjB (DUF3815 family)
MEAVTQLVTACIGSLGFALLFGMQKKYLAASSLGGMITWGIYMAMNAWLDMSFLACLAASSFAIVYSEVLARIYKTPATMFIMPSVVPLVPGGPLYYAMSEAVRGNMQQAGAYGRETLLFALAIASGICLVTAVRDLKHR